MDYILREQLDMCKTLRSLAKTPSTRKLVSLAESALTRTRGHFTEQNPPLIQYEIDPSTKFESVAIWHHLLELSILHSLAVPNSDLIFYIKDTIDLFGNILKVYDPEDKHFDFLTLLLPALAILGSIVLFEVVAIGLAAVAAAYLGSATVAGIGAAAACGGGLIAAGLEGGELIAGGLASTEFVAGATIAGSIVEGIEVTGLISGGAVGAKIAGGFQSTEFIASGPGLIGDGSKGLEIAKIKPRFVDGFRSTMADLKEVPFGLRDLITDAQWDNAAREAYMDAQQLTRHELIGEYVTSAYHNKISFSDWVDLYFDIT